MEEFKSLIYQEKVDSPCPTNNKHLARRKGKLIQRAESIYLSAKLQEEQEQHSNSWNRKQVENKHT